MNITAIVVLAVFCLVLIALLVVLIRKWYVQTGSAKAKTSDNDLRMLIAKAHDAIGRSATFKKKLARVEINILIAQVKAWLKEEDHDRLGK